MVTVTAASYCLAAGLLETIPTTAGVLHADWTAVAGAARAHARRCGDPDSTADQLRHLILARALRVHPSGAIHVARDTTASAACPFCPVPLDVPWPPAPSGVAALDEHLTAHVDAMCAVPA